MTTDEKSAEAGRAERAVAKARAAARRAAALRENLKRRKALQRARTDAPGPGADAEEPPDAV